ncbi:MAG: Hpt domain-containing protein [Erysipelotrichaceae bacterium]|nr:Hpt domain-containing protein [Erysipelotrichaceae bacterium]
MKAEFYHTLHIDYQDAMHRFFNNESLFLDMLKLFPGDPTFNELEKALSDNDVEAAFMAAHTLKSVSANLSLKRLYELNFPLVEDLRSGDLKAAQKRFPELKKEYHLIINGIHQI